MSRRKLSIHIIGRGPREDASAASAALAASTASARNNRAVGVGLETSTEQKSGGGVVLDFVESAALFPKSHHVDDIEAFRSKLFVYPAAAPSDK